MHVVLHCGVLLRYKIVIGQSGIKCNLQLIQFVEMDESIEVIGTIGIIRGRTLSEGCHALPPFSPLRYSRKTVHDHFYLGLRLVFKNRLYSPHLLINDAK